MTETGISGARGFHVSGSLIGIRIRTGTGTYIPGPGVQSIDVECVGSGAGAGGVLGIIALKGAAPGGGSGTTCRKFITPVSASGYSYEVGLGGPGGEGANSGEGEDGSSTFFGGILTAPGEVHSVFAVADSGVGALTILGGAAGTSATGGDFNTSGLPGGTSFNLVSLGTSTDCLSGAGADRPGFGTGGAAWRGGSHDGNSGVGYGAGGGGAVTDGVTSRNGGSGADGVIVLYEYS